MFSLRGCFLMLVFTLVVVYGARPPSLSSLVTHLEPGDEISFDPRGENRMDSNFQIYCYSGKPKYVVHIWQSVNMQIDCKNDKFVQYDGNTPNEVMEKYQEHMSSWSINLFSMKQKNFKLNPFNQSCVGIDSKEKYSIHLNVIRVDYWKVILLALGIALFLSADRLSSNTLFYYICGITFGNCASFLILIYFISKLFPKKPMMYGTVIFGWSVGIYILQMLWENLQVILISYQTYVVWYIVGTGLISFVVCYRWGPVTNQRTKNLIRWMLKGLGLTAIFLSSQFQEAAVGQIVILLLAHNFPKSWLNKSKTYWKRKFPPKVKFISNDEYYRQGVLETSKALDQLRGYCSSPNCNQWKTVLQLKDVKRFASFMEGNSHLSDNEILDYESSIQQTDLTDDEEESILTDEED